MSRKRKKQLFRKHTSQGNSQDKGAGPEIALSAWLKKRQPAVECMGMIPLPRARGEQPPKFKLVYSREPLHSE